MQMRLYNARGHKLRLLILWEAQFVTVKGIAHVSSFRLALT
jgi:hypothetical protein